MKIDKRNTVLCIPPAVASLVDAGLTLFGQHPIYWTQGYYYVLEGDPWAAYLLKIHPMAFLLGIMLWIFAYSLIIILLPPKPAAAVAAIVLFWHAWGAANWFYFHNILNIGLYLAHGCLALLAVLLTVVMREHFKKARDDNA